MNSDDTVLTAHGRLDKAALLEVQNTYDTRALLTAVEQLDKFLAEARGQNGLRDMLLRLHAMAHAIINGAELSASTGKDTLPELASDTAAELYELASMLERWIKQIEPLEGLRARN